MLPGLAPSIVGGLPVTAYVTGDRRSMITVTGTIKGLTSGRSDYTTLVNGTTSAPIVEINSRAAGNQFRFDFGAKVLVTEAEQAARRCAW